MAASRSPLDVLLYQSFFPHLVAGPIVRAHEFLAPLAHAEPMVRVTAERALNKHLNGGCQVPIACYAVLEGEQVWLRGLVGDPKGGLLLSADGRAPQGEAQALGVQVAQALLAQGADAILQAVYGETGEE